MLHTLKPSSGSKRLRKRVGRGNSAGGGTTAGRGTKGQHARTGKGRRLGFEGGQTPLIRRQPKLGGFRSPNRKEYEVVNLDVLEQVLDTGAYDTDALREKRLVCTKKPVKILGSRGTIKKKFTFTVDAVSKGAREAIEKAGGTVIVKKRT
ncbi:50S ribosomal protein L15 [Candidatus Peribacteria bacterium RIFCSPHIGHO2_02_FULL_49_16]|nr:MAG: 50S ribosomal protein L15 [Candidatus Peribacteria bacterium RIFCSPHIGHO2_01_FULL_49_38]OGJ59709.1 MAG: 50S ribosomal protein L15 [Candidatus Peribacteria bacterium RIFCSPHIGHO2_02_FULL_49_16]